MSLKTKNIYILSRRFFCFFNIICVIKIAPYLKRKKQNKLSTPVLFRLFICFGVVKNLI